MKFNPHEYQKPLIKRLKDEKSFGLFAFPGSGKTAMALEAICHHKKPTLIIAPLSILYATWLNEPNKWDFSKNLTISVLHGSAKAENFNKRANIYLINPEGIPWLVDKIKNTRRFPFKLLIVDESVKFKNPKSKRFKELKKILRTFENKYILCGNPIPNKFEDLWAQLQILDLGQRLGTSFYNFRQEFFYPTDYKRFNWELKPGAKEEIIRKISDIVNFVEVDEILELPDRVVIDLELEMPNKAQKMYTKMETDLFAILDQEDEEKILAQNRTSALMKCWQIANGFLYSYDESDNRSTHFIHDELIEITKEKVEELQGRPILITYNFNEDERRLIEAFPNATIVNHGSQMKQIEDDWNKGKINILLAQIHKLSHGVNLQYGPGRNILFYSLTYNFDTYDQLIRRFERQGSKHSSIIIWRLIVKNTIHKAIIKTIESKNSMSKDFLIELKNYKNNR